MFAIEPPLRGARRGASYETFDLPQVMVISSPVLFALGHVNSASRVGMMGKGIGGLEAGHENAG
jgi:hypothetical protein